MKNQYYAIKDNVSELFMTPVLFQNENVAKRWFKDVINNESQNETIFNNPQDFELWKLGIYDNETGVIESFVQKILSGSAAKEAK